MRPASLLNHENGSFVFYTKTDRAFSVPSARSPLSSSWPRLMRGVKEFGDTALYLKVARKSFGRSVFLRKIRCCPSIHIGNKQLLRQSKRPAACAVNSSLERD